MNGYIVKHIGSKNCVGIFFADSVGELWWALDELGNPFDFCYCESEGLANTGFFFKFDVENDNNGGDDGDSYQEYITNLRLNSDTDYSDGIRDSANEVHAESLEWKSFSDDQFEPGFIIS